MQDPELYKILDMLATKHSYPSQNEDNKGAINYDPNSATKVVQDAKEALSKKLMKTGSAHIIGIFGWEMRRRQDSSKKGNEARLILSKQDTIADIAYWNGSFRQTDSVIIRDSVLSYKKSLTDSDYVNRIPPVKTHAHSILMTDVRNLDDNLYLSTVNLKIEIRDTNFYKFKFGPGLWILDISTIVYYPLKTQPAIVTNLIVLVIIFILLCITFVRRLTINEHFHKYFRIAVSFMIIVFVGFLLPSIIPGVFPETRFIANALRLLPDNAMFFIAALCLLFDWKETRIKWIIGLVFVHVLTNSWELRYTLPILFRSDSMAFVPDRMWRELPPQVFGGISLILVGIGIYWRGKKILELVEGSNPSGMYVWLVSVFSSLFVVYGLLQPFFSFLSDKIFFVIVLLAKGFAFFSIILFSNMYVVLGRFRQQHVEAETIINASPFAMIVFDSDGKIERISQTAFQQFDRGNGKAKNMKDMLADDVEWDFLHRVTETKSQKKNLLLDFKGTEGKKLDCLVSYVPIEGNTMHLITIRPLDKAVLDEIADSIQSHSTKGKVVAALNFLDQLLKPIKEVYGFKEIEEDERFIKMKQLLSSTIDSLTQNCH
jgi:hypothetical protein